MFYYSTVNHFIHSTSIYHIPALLQTLFQLDVEHNTAWDRATPLVRSQCHGGDRLLEETRKLQLTLVRSKTGAWMNHGSTETQNKCTSRSWLFFLRDSSFWDGFSRMRINFSKSYWKAFQIVGIVCAEAWECVKPAKLSSMCLEWDRSVRKKSFKSGQRGSSDLIMRIYTSS